MLFYFLMKNRKEHLEPQVLMLLRPFCFDFNLGEWHLSKPFALFSPLRLENCLSMNMMCSIWVGLKHAQKTV